MNERQNTRSKKSQAEAHRKRYDDNVINCITGKVNCKKRYDIGMKIMSTNECDNNNIDKFKNLTDRYRKFLKIIHFNAQGLFEGMHFEQICD